MRRTSDAFGSWVREIKGKDSLRAADAKTGVNYNTISNMELGKVPEMETVVKFALGYQQDVNEALELAGYPRIEDSQQLLDAGLYQISKELGVVVTYNGEKPAHELTPDEVREYLQIAREEAGKG